MFWYPHVCVLSVAVYIHVISLAVRRLTGSRRHRLHIILHLEHGKRSRCRHQYTMHRTSIHLSRIFIPTHVCTHAITRTARSQHSSCLCTTRRARSHSFFHSHTHTYEYHESCLRNSQSSKSARHTHINKEHTHTQTLTSSMLSG